MLQHHKIVFTQHLCAHLNIVSPCLCYARRPKHVVLCLYMPKRKNIVQIEVSLIQRILIIGSVPGCARRAIGIVSDHA